MNANLILEPPPARMTRAYAFTLATALVWIGHDCTGGCPVQAKELPAAVWFVDDSAAAGGESNDTLVVVRFGATPTPHSATRHSTLLRQVNDCVRGDHIHVREREATTWDGALAALFEQARSESVSVVGDPLFGPRHAVLEALIPPTTEDGVDFGRRTHGARRVGSAPYGGGQNRGPLGVVHAVGIGEEADPLGGVGVDQPG